MGIVAIQAGHLALADGVVIGKAGLCLLLLVALQALVVQGGARLQRPPLSAASFGGMDRMTAAAFEILCGMSAGKPVAHVIGLGVAAQAGAVGFFGRAILEADDLVFRLLRVATSSQMQASGTVTLLTLNIAHGVLASPIVLGHLGVTLRTLITADFRCTLDFYVLGEILMLFFRGPGLGFRRNRWRDEKCNYRYEEKCNGLTAAEAPDALRHSALPILPQTRRRVTRNP